MHIHKGICFGLFKGQPTAQTTGKQRIEIPPIQPP